MMSTTEGELDLEGAREREEGELEDSDLEGGAYIPLARPDTFNPPSLVHMQIQDEQSDEASQEESSGSDSDEPQRRPKRTKLRPKRLQSQPEKKNKYNIWCKSLQEDLLTEDMVGCDVTKNRRYGVESYDYTIKYRLDDEYVSKKPFSQANNSNVNSFCNKRNVMDRQNVKLRLGKRMNSHKNAEVKQEPRILADLSVNTNDSIDIVATDIAEKLAEEKKDLLVKIVQVLGASTAIEIYKETQKVESEGGMLVMNGTRRRTPGGIYFFLLKRNQDVSQEMIGEIFTEDRRETQRKVKKARTKSRQKVVEALKQSLTDSELPALLSRGETTVTRSEHGSNPPPSPATDARDCSSDTDAHTDAHTHSPPRKLDGETRLLQNYDDDDYLEVMCNEDMDLF